MTDKGEEILLPEKADWGIYERENIKRISPPYAVQSGLATIINLKPRKKAKKLPGFKDITGLLKDKKVPVTPQTELAPTTLPLGQDNAASKAVGVPMHKPYDKSEAFAAKIKTKTKTNKEICGSCAHLVSNEFNGKCKGWGYNSECTDYDHSQYHPTDRCIKPETKPRKSKIKPIRYRCKNLKCPSKGKKLKLI